MDLLFHQILTMSFVGTSVLLLVLFSRIFLKNVSATWRYSELKVVLLLFLVPTTAILEKILQLFPKSTVPIQKVTSFTAVVERNASTVMEPIPIAEVTTSYVQATTSSFMTSDTLLFVPSLLWIFVGLFLAFFKIRRFTRWKALERVAKLEEQKDILAILHEEKNLLMYQKEVKLVRWDITETPLVTGVFQPKIFLTQQEYTPLQLRQIFRHELYHLKSGDVSWNFLLQMVEILHFFNPFIYLFVKKFREEMEFSCDEKVAKTLSFQEKREYFYTLLDSVSLKDPVFRYGLGFSTTKQQLERRFTHMLKLKNMKTSTKIISTFLLGCMLLGASAYNLPPISADYKLQKEVEKVLLSDPDIVDAAVHIHNDGKVYIDFEDKFINETVYSCNEEMNQRYTEIWALVAETAGVDVRDVHHFIQGEYELKTAIQEQKTFVEEITEIKPFHQYDLSPQDWEYLLTRVEKGEVVYAEVSEDAQYFWDTWYQMERTPTAWSIYPTHIGDITTAQRTLALPVFNDIGSGAINYFWYYGENEEALCETSFDHLYSDGTVVSYDFCETWELTEEKTLFDIDQGR